MLPNLAGREYVGKVFKAVQKVNNYTLLGGQGRSRPGTGRGRAEGVRNAESIADKKTRTKNNGPTPKAGRHQNIPTL